MQSADIALSGMQTDLPPGITVLTLTHWPLGEVARSRLLLGEQQLLIPFPRQYPTSPKMSSPLRITSMTIICQGIWPLLAVPCKVTTLTSISFSHFHSIMLEDSL